MYVCVDFCRTFFKLNDCLNLILNFIRLRKNIRNFKQICNPYVVQYLEDFTDREQIL